MLQSHAIWIKKCWGNISKVDEQDVCCVLLDQTMEIYIDDMVINSKKESDHIRDLDECF